MFTKIDKSCVTLEIQKPGIIRILTYLKADTYSEPSKRFKMEFIVKIVKSYNYFSTIIIQNPVYYCKFRHIHAYSRPIQMYSAIL